MGTNRSEIRTVFSEELRRATHRTWFRVMTLAVPALLLVMVIAVPMVRGLLSSDEDGEAEAVRIGFLDLSGYVSVEAVAETGFHVFPDREAGVAALVGDEVESFFIIPEDYLDTGRVALLYTGSMVSARMSMETHTSQIQAWLREVLIADAVQPEVEKRFVWPATFESIVVGEGGSTKEGVEEVGPFSVSYIFAILLMMSLLVGSGYLLESVSDEKENRMIEVLLTSVSPLTIMAGKLLALGLVGLLQVAVWAVSIALIGPRILESFPGIGQLDIDPVLLVWLVAFFVAGYLVFGVTMAGIGAATTTHREASKTSMMLLLPAAVPLWSFMLIAGNPDGVIARVLSFIPFTAPTTMMLRMGASDVPLLESLGSLIVTVLCGVLLLWGSARVFRAGLLMYGQRMSLRRVVTALRQAG